MNTIRLAAYAKINLSLDVIARYSNGYHQLSSVMQSISLCDYVTVTRREKGLIRLISTHRDLPLGSDNIASLAAQKMIDKFDLKMGFQIEIDKRIPIAAGLAGGSSDAAAVLRAIVKLANLTVEPRQLSSIAKSLGADVPFCLQGGTCLAEGIGESLTAIDHTCQYWLVLVNPGVALSTAQVFQRLELQNIAKRPHTVELVRAVRTCDYKAMARSAHNVLEAAALQLQPQIGEIKERLADCGALFTQMTGSGATVFAVFTDRRRAARAKRQLAERYRHTYLVKPVSGGHHEH